MRRLRNPGAPHAVRGKPRPEPARAQRDRVAAGSPRSGTRSPGGLPGAARRPRPDREGPHGPRPHTPHHGGGEAPHSPVPPIMAAASLPSWRPGPLPPCRRAFRRRPGVPRAALAVVGLTHGACGAAAARRWRRRRTRGVGGGPAGPPQPPSASPRRSPASPLPHRRRQLRGGGAGGEAPGAGGGGRRPLGRRG